jgi:hypothetical protein
MPHRKQIPSTPSTVSDKKGEEKEQSPSSVDADPSSVVADPIVIADDKEDGISHAKKLVAQRDPAGRGKGGPWSSAGPLPGD